MSFMLVDVSFTLGYIRLCEVMLGSGRLCQFMLVGQDVELDNSNFSN